MTRQPNDDLFQDSRMSFGQHLEELRKVLVKCLIFIGIGCAVGFFVADRVVSFLQVPLVRAIKNYNDEAALEKYTNLLEFYPPEIENELAAGRAPQTVYIDPGQFVEAIRAISPNALEGVDLRPYRFDADCIETDDVTAVSSQITGLDQGKPDEQRQQQLSLLQSMLPSEQLAALETCQNDLAGRQLMVSALNELIDRRELHEHKSFQSFFEDPKWSWQHLINAPPENQLKLMKRVVDKSPSDPELSRRLNRVLLAKLFDQQIKPPDINLVPIELWQNITEGTQALSPHEVFMVWVKAAVITGLILSAPFVFHQIWLFVAAGLYPHEQKYVYYYLPLSIILFVLGVCLAFFFVFDPVLQFLFSFNSSMGIAPQLRIGEWLSFVMFLPLGFGIAFQLPLVMLFLNRIGVVSVELYKNNWRMAVMIISVLSMLLTPADPISMVMLGGPLTLLYFFGIGLCKWMPKPQNPYRDDAAAPV